MPSFRRRASLIDADRVDQPLRQPERSADADEARALAEEAEAEAAEAEAIAAAAGARARAIKLRRAADEARAQPREARSEAEVGPADVATEVAEAPDAETPDEADGGVDETAAEKRGRWRRPRLRRPGWKTVAVALAVLCTAALLAASGYMTWQHRQAVNDEQQAAEYVAAGRQGIVTLMSLNFEKAQEDVQRIVDNSTGQFREDFQAQAEDFVKIAQEAKVVTDATVNAAAVYSMTDDSAVVLVAATSRVTNNSGARDQSRSFRLSVDLQREGDQIKMSRVEFVP